MDFNVNQMTCTEYCLKDLVITQVVWGSRKGTAGHFVTIVCVPATIGAMFKA